MNPDINTMKKRLREAYRRRHPDWVSMPDWELNDLIQKFGIAELYAEEEAAGEFELEVDLVKSSQLGFEVPELTEMSKLIDISELTEIFKLTEEDIESFGKVFLKNIDRIAEIDDMPEDSEVPTPETGNSEGSNSKSEEENNA